jgi:hypothetical protein
MSSSSTLDQMAERAQRQLDGMTVNCDAMARDLLKLIEAVRGMQSRAAVRTDNNPPAFEDVWDNIFGGFKGAGK